MTSGTTSNYFDKFPIEAFYHVFENMNEKDQLNFALTCTWIHNVFRIYHVGYASPEWIPIDITPNTDEGTNGGTNIHKDLSSTTADGDPGKLCIPPAANYRGGVLVNGKLYLTIIEEKSPICWILDFDEEPLRWARERVRFIEATSLFEDSNDKSDGVDHINACVSKLKTVPANKYQPFQSTIAATIPPMIYLFNGTLYELDTRNMTLKEVMGQGGDLPPPRKMHSLNAINGECLVLFGGRCIMNDVDNPREYDTRDFYIYDISTRNWATYRDPYAHVPYPRSLHSSTVINSSLYIYGGQQITSTSIPHSRVHDDEDLWCFTFSSPNNHSTIADVTTTLEDSADEGQKTPQSTSSQSNSSDGRISSSFQQDKWQKLFSPKSFTSTAFSSGINGEWHVTTGKNVGKRCGAAMFGVGRRVAVLGGYERDDWKWSVDEDSVTSLQAPSKVGEGIEDRIDGESSEQRKPNTTVDKETEKKPWELCKLYIPDRKRWDQVRIVGFPEMECIAITKDHTSKPSDVFVIGRKRGGKEEQGITMGWIIEPQRKAKNN